MNKDEALKLVLEFFETMQRYKGVRSNIFIKFEPTATGDYVDLREFDERAKPIITAIKQALAAPVQEPVLWRRWDEDSEQWLVYVNKHADDLEPLYTTPSAQPAPVQDAIPKIGCVNHDCDKCKAAAQPAPVQKGN